MRKGKAGFSSMHTSETAPIEEKLEALAADADSGKGCIDAVYRALKAKQRYSERLIFEEMQWFFTALGLDAFYFETTPPETVADHIESLHAGKLLSKAGPEAVNQSWETYHNGTIMLACFDRREITNKIERRIDAEYHNFRIRSYRSRGTMAPDSDVHFRLYFISPTEAGITTADGARTTDIERIGDENLLLTMSEATKARYQMMVDTANAALGPVIAFIDRPKRGSMNLLVAYRRGSTHSYFSAIFDLLHAYGIPSDRSYVEQFANGIVLYSIHIPRSTPKGVLENLKEDLSLFYALPRTSLTSLFRSGKLTAQEVTYAYVALRFACQFLTRYRETYAALAPAFRDDPVKLGLLGRMRQRLSKDTFTQERVTETIRAFPEAIKLLYKDFHDNHYIPEDAPPRSYDETGGAALRRILLKTTATQIDLDVLEAFLDFNRHVTKTNFYRSSKIALSFRLDPSFTADIDYPDRPFAVFLVIGSEFRGFHLRFRDIARGGIRIITSPSHQAFVHNSDMLFHECYNLAHTQQKKNKDIPEGGSKGVILLSFEHRNRGDVAFKKYVDALLDLILKTDRRRITAHEQELLFFGPDEGTADLMDWASEHARHRGYPFWKSFTTGKSMARGGIPHDRYGMTTRSVHQYVLGILEKRGLDEHHITKFQTGGPDGDLGSNEIKVSRDKTIAVVDGSGVLYDPNGIDRPALTALAEARQPVAGFDRTKLGPGGFLVEIDDRDVTLPDGTLVESGLVFRNGFHLTRFSTADLFVPCGGRPNAVHINNVDKLFDADGKPRFRFIVEGANLFFTPEARLALENAGVILIKDASANKGGVTSSSLEVLAGLSLSDEAFESLMTVKEGKIPPFYNAYVQEAKAIIARNAKLELECIWREHQATGERSSRLSDNISGKINRLTDDLLGSGLSSDPVLRRAVLVKVIPPVLQQAVGIDTIIKRLPGAYLEALFAAHLASNYVYTYGLSASETRFVAFLRQYTDGDAGGIAPSP